jgi:hypothetical protein
MSFEPGLESEGRVPMMQAYNKQDGGKRRKPQQG